MRHSFECLISFANKKAMKKISFVIVSSLLLFSCDRFGNKETTTTEAKQRIVCVSKQLNEIIFAVGGDTSLVGIDISSTYPPETKKLTTVGYHRGLNAEGIISLNPTVVWHDGNIAPETAIEQVKKVGIPMREFHAGPTIDSTKILIMQVAGEFHNEAKGKELCAKLDADIAKLDSAKKTYSDTPKVLIIHFGQAANKYFVLSRSGVPNKMLEWAGAINAADTAQKWKDLSAEVIAADQPDVILATDFGYDLQGSLDKFKALPGIALSPAAKNDRIYRIEEHDLVYLGPRSGENVLKIMQMVHQSKTK